MSLPNKKESFDYISLFKSLFHTEPKRTLYGGRIPPFREVEFYEREYKGVKYLLVSSVYPNHQEKNYDGFVLIKIPYLDYSIKNNEILDKFEISLFGKRTIYIDSELADNLDYEEVKERKVQFPSFRVLDSLEEADKLARELIEHYKKSVKKSRNKKFLREADRIVKEEKREFDQALLTFDKVVGLKANKSFLREV